MIFRVAREFWEMMRGRDANGDTIHEHAAKLCAQANQLDKTIREAQRPPS